MDQYGNLEPEEEYLYEHFVFHLHQGREFDFVYKGDKYAISHGKYRYFTKYGDADNVQSFNTIEELLENLRIDNKTIQEIWKDIEVTGIY